jgi:hypothetical protein
VSTGAGGEGGKKNRDFEILCVPLGHREEITWEDSTTKKGKKFSLETKIN